MSAREEILRRIRAAQNPSAATLSIAEAPHPHILAPDAMLELFVDNLRDYRAVVHETTADDAAELIDSVLATHGCASVVVAPGLDLRLRPTSIDIVEDHGLTAGDLDRIDAVITTCAIGIAQTGTIVLDHSGSQGRRALSLVPDVHVCVVEAEQVVTSVPEAVALLRGSIDDGLPLTWISGPSATSDIELDRVEGVHGPRQLEVLLLRTGTLG